MAFVNESVKNLLLRAKFSKDRTNIDNGHAVMAQDLPRLQAMAAALGLNFNDTEYTYQAVRKEGELNIYGACVMSYAGKAAICWGRVNKLFTEVPKTTELSIVQDGKSFVLDVYVPNASNPAESLNFQVPIVISKTLKDKPEHVTLRNAFRTGALGDFLMPAFVKAKKLADVEPGTYQVTGYAIRYFNGDPKVDINVEGVGLVSGNMTIKNKLMANPEISVEKPATLEVGISTRVTAKGYAVVPVVLTTQADSELPVFDFTEPSDYVVQEQLEELTF